MLFPEYTSRFQKDYKRLLKKRADVAGLDDVMRLVVEDTGESRSELARRHGCHSLRGKWSGSHECHVDNSGDLLLVWRTEGETVYFQRAGSHDDIFR